MFNFEEIAAEAKAYTHDFELTTSWGKLDRLSSHPEYIFIYLREKGAKFHSDYIAIKQSEVSPSRLKELFSLSREEKIMTMTAALGVKLNI